MTQTKHGTPRRTTHLDALLTQRYCVRCFEDFEPQNLVLVGLRKVLPRFMGCSFYVFNGTTTRRVTGRVNEKNTADGSKTSPSES